MWVTQLPSGRWRGGFRMPTTGKKVHRSFDYEYEAEAWAQSAEAAARHAAATGAGPEPEQPPVIQQGNGGPTVAAHARDWIARRRGHLSVATVKQYEAAIRAFTPTGIAPLTLVGIRRPDVEAWMTRQVEAGVGRPSINLRLKVLRMILKDAVAAGLCDRNATDAVKTLKTDIRAHRVLTRAEESRLLIAAGEELHLMCLLALDAGLRWEEAAALAGNCVNGDYLEIRQVVERDTRSIRRYPKGSRQRVVPMTDRLAATVGAYLQTHPRTGEELLFGTGDTGERPQDYWNWRRDKWRPTCEAAKLEPRPRFHDLRHTYGTRLAGAGVPRHEIAMLMGHADESTTARYIHAATDGRRRDLVREALTG